MRTLAVGCILVLALLLAGCGTSSSQHRPRRIIDEASLCTGHPASTHWKHVVWIFFENRSADETRSWAYPRNVLIPMCASLSRMSAEQHASLGNYIAATTGSPAGIHGGCAPSVCPITRDSIFAQVARSGREWRSYAESMPTNC